MYPDRHFEVEGEVNRYEALLQMADLVVHHRTLPELLPELAQRLQKVASFDIASFSLYDPDKNVMRMHFWDGDEVLPDLTELPVDDSACGFVWENQQAMVWSDLYSETRFQQAVRVLTEKGVRSYCTLPLTTAQKRFGALGLGSSRCAAYGEDDVRLLQRVAELVALAMENAITRAAFLEERERQGTLLEVTTALMSNPDVKELFPSVAALIRKVVRQDYASLALSDEASCCLRVSAVDRPLSEEIMGADAVVPIAESVAGLAMLKGEAIIRDKEDLLAVGFPSTLRMVQLGIQSFCAIPLITHKGRLGTLNLGSTVDHAFAAHDITFLKQVAAQIAIALDNARAYREIAELTDKLKKRNFTCRMRYALRSTSKKLSVRVRRYSVPWHKSTR